MPDLPFKGYPPIRKRNLDVKKAIFFEYILRREINALFADVNSFKILAYIYGKFPFYREPFILSFFLSLAGIHE